MRIIKIYIAFCILLVSCHHTETTAEAHIEVKTPVTVTGIQNTSISENISLNASSTYQKKNQVKSTITGYVESVFVNIGDHIKTGTPMFTIKTKEAEALNGINTGDALFKFKGIITIYSPSTGVVVSVDKQPRDYVNDGDMLSLIAEKNSFVFLLNVPFELNKYATIGKSCNITLPDKTSIEGVIATRLSTIDIVSQTQPFVVKPKTDAFLPEGLLATIQLTKSSKTNAQVLQKQCVLTDETMEHFWVMKLINDSTAIKIPVTRGIVTEDKVEIVSPQFNQNDRIINAGNYGLTDTAFVKITQP